MSILFGMHATYRGLIEEPELQRLAEATARYAPEGTSLVTRRNVGMGFQSYVTHQRAKLTSQPVTASRGNLLALDGRIDNYEGLSDELGLKPQDVADTEIVLSAFDRWGHQCFSRFVGEWALALWSAADQTLYLARDHAGVRTLYYEEVDGRVRWSTYLDTFLVDSRRRRINEAYAACYLTGALIGDLTPFDGVHAVPPAHFVRFREGRISRARHWTPWRARPEIRYQSDSEYCEHFLASFKQAVTRRTGPGAPLICQLSGGMDSSSIVCVADLIRKESGADVVDTISHYDDSEPTWDERPFFTAVERARGKEGIHFETSYRRRDFTPVARSVGACVWPGSDNGSVARERALADVLDAREIRAIVSGKGGDELLGGVPTGTPELADLLIRAQFRALTKRAFGWCLQARSPLLHELIDVGKSTGIAYLGLRRRGSVPQWLARRLTRLPDASRCRDASIMCRSGLLPSRIFAAEAWESILESLPHLQPGLHCRYEFRYPYLDRDLVDFLLALPRTQLARPGRRRYMMRNAMREIVPEEVLERRRKASVQRGPVVALRNHRHRIECLLDGSILSQRGLVDQRLMMAALEEAWTSKMANMWPSLLRLINLEIWARGMEGKI